MKKIFFILSAACILTTAAAAFEANAKISFEGSIVEESKEKSASKATFEAFKLNAMPFADKNGITINMNGGIAGGSFSLFYKLDGAAKAEDGWPVSARGTNIWFKPIDQLKLKFGYVGTDYFLCERVYGERVGSPFALIHRGVTVPKYVANADVDEMGFYLGVSPIEGLILSAAVAPGIEKPGLHFGESNEYASWGATAEYIFDNWIFEAAYRDNGKKSWKVIRAGVGYETENLFAFVQPVVSVEYHSNNDTYFVDGICADLYAEYTMLEALKLTAYAPVTIRLTGSEQDPSYMEYLAKVEYNFGELGLLDDVTPYVFVESATPVTFDKNAADSFAMNAQLGTSFKVGYCESDIGFCLKVHGNNETSEKLTWSIPFSVRIDL